MGIFSCLNKQHWGDVMTFPNVLKLLTNGLVIPAPRTIEDFKYALTQTSSLSIILLFGDIGILPGLLLEARKQQKRLLIHMDLLEGIGKDKAGVRFLAQMGVTAIITTKSHIGKLARSEGMIVVQRLFLMDSEALKCGINTLRNFRPDALEILPASVPASVVQLLERETGLPILAGGLMSTVEDIKAALSSGICAVSTSNRELWREFSGKMESKRLRAL
jgi:glycerol uptake operon antiterminator